MFPARICRDMNERQERRAALAPGPGWQPYAAKIRPLRQSQDSEIPVPAAIFWPQWRRNDRHDSDHASAESVSI